MTDATEAKLRAHLIRPDGQEDICLATYRPSSGGRRWSAVLREVLLPEPGERAVHGNASFTGEYVMRAAEAARSTDCGVVVLHSHPGASRWQGMSAPDADAEGSYAFLASELTGLPLVGMTLAGRDGAWSARRWSTDGTADWAENVRVVGSRLRMTWNDDVRPVPRAQRSQLRTISGWGGEVQKDVARLRVLVVGLGSVGLEVALRLAATGIEVIGLMDFDVVEVKNLDRLIGASPADAWLGRSKIEVARRLILEASTAMHPQPELHDLSVCEPAGLAAALDYDVIFSCVDRPWARAALNTIAYSDLVPVIDGGIHIDPFPEGGMRNATWRSHVVRPGRPCLACNGQLDLSSVSLDREGLLDDPAYIAGADVDVPSTQNVAVLSVSVVAALLSQFVSFVVAPGGQGEPGPLQYVLSTHTQEILDRQSRPHCAFEMDEASGDRRLAIAGSHRGADAARSSRQVRVSRVEVRLGTLADRVLLTLDIALRRIARKRTDRLR